MARKGGLMVKRKISAKKIIEDLRAGLNDDQLIEKYSLKPRTLQYIFRKMVQAGLMTDLEFYERSRLTESEVFRAFSDEPDALLRCPDCGRPLPEHGTGCVFCLTMEGLAFKTDPASELMEGAGGNVSSSPNSTPETAKINPK